jgi:hypothetical protein
MQQDAQIQYKFILILMHVCHNYLYVIQSKLWPRLKTHCFVLEPKNGGNETAV